MNKHFLCALGAVVLLAESCFAAASTWQTKITQASTSAAAEALVSQIQATMRGKSGAKLAQLQKDLKDALERARELRQHELTPAPGAHGGVVPGRGYVLGAPKIRHDSSDEEVEARALDRVRKGRGGGLKRGGRGARTGDPDKDLASERARLFNKRQKLAVKERRAVKGRKAATGAPTKEVKAHRGFNQQQVQAALEVLLGDPANVPQIAMAKCIAEMCAAIKNVATEIQAIAACGATNANDTIADGSVASLSNTPGDPLAVVRVAAEKNALNATGAGNNPAGVAICAALGAVLYGLAQSLPADTAAPAAGAATIGAAALSQFVGLAVADNAAIKTACGCDGLGGAWAAVQGITHAIAGQVVAGGEVQTAIGAAPAVVGAVAVPAAWGAAAGAVAAVAGPFPANAPGLVAAATVAAATAKNVDILKKITVPVAADAPRGADHFALATDPTADVQAAIPALGPKHAALVACTKDDLHSLAAAQLCYWVDAELAAHRYHGAGELAAKFREFSEAMKTARSQAKLADAGVVVGGHHKIKDIRKGASPGDLAKIAARKAGRHGLKNKAAKRKLQHTIMKGANLAQQAAAAREALDGTDDQNIALGVTAVETAVNNACTAAGIAQAGTVVASANDLTTELGRVIALPGVADAITANGGARRALSVEVTAALVAAAAGGGGAPGVAPVVDPRIAGYDGAIVALNALWREFDGAAIPARDANLATAIGQLQTMIQVAKAVGSVAIGNTRSKKEAANLVKAALHLAQIR